MPYSTLEGIRIAAGGTASASARLAEVSHSEDPDVLAAVQARADAWIDGITRKINSAAVPWNTTTAPEIKSLAEDEVYYILLVQSGIAVQAHHDAHKERQATLEAIAAGKVMPSSDDAYPVGDGGGAPVVVDRGAQIASGATSSDGTCPTDWSTEGFL